MRTISETIFTLIDTETSGKLDSNPELLEVAYLEIDALGEVLRKFQTLVKPTRPVPPEASGVNGLVTRDFVDAPSRSEVDARLQAEIRSEAVFVAHYAFFDRTILTPSGLAERDWLCTERLAHHLMPECNNFKLGTVRYTISDEPLDTGEHRAHRALADVLVLKFVFLHELAVWQRGREQVGKDPNDLYAFLEFSQQPIRIKRMEFGKHGPQDGKPGTLIRDLPTDYIHWCLKNFDRSDRADLLWNLEREIDRREGRNRLVGVA